MAAGIKQSGLLALCLLIVVCGYARHITGGEITYDFLRVSGNNISYRVTLKLYRDCYSTGAQLDPAAAISIYAKTANGTSHFRTESVTLTHRVSLNLQDPGKCINNPPVVCYELGTYEFTVDLPISEYGYIIAYQRCCRIENMTNIRNSGEAGATYTASVPGTDVDNTAPQNSSPKFATKDTVVVCQDNFFMYDFSATDADGDSLSYHFCDAYLGGSMRDPQPGQASPPPFSAVNYSFGYNSSYPLGNQVTVNPRTGIVSGIAPYAGIYVLTVCVNEFRNGKIINVHRKDIQIKVTACNIAEASLEPEYINCESFTMDFRNRSNSPMIKSYYWEFGDPANSTSTEERPSFTYSDTGVYTIRLITNRFEECSDTANAVVKVYPGFFPDFSITEGCKDVPYNFTDRTTATYGVVNSWQWDFGVSGTADVAYTRSAPFTYTSSGTYSVALTVGTSMGCQTTLNKELIVREKPLLSLPKDTLMCNIDTISITANGPSGTYTWAPNYNISSLSGPTVQVSPQTTTTYSVSLTTVPGCTTTDTVRVNVVSFVTLNAGADLTMCRTDSVQLFPTSDGLRYEWTPAATIVDPLAKNAVVSPVDEYTTYSVTAHIGKCSATDQLTIRAVPYPTVNISPDTAICYGESVQLLADGGRFYNWTPSTNINSYTINNPIVSPPVTTAYTVSVTDVLGCPKPTVKTVEVRVVPPVPAFAGNDTVAVLGQNLQLLATGGTNYSWHPGNYLSDTDIANPVATFEGDVGHEVKYVVRVSTPEGCFAYDTLGIKIFRTLPDIFIPTGFTPNNDGLNDVFKAIPVGIKTFDYLKIFNRWGQLLFETTDASKAWNGQFKGMDQASDTYVWMVSGIDFLDRPISKKGTFVLIR